MEKKQLKSSTKITKVTLVIYCLIALVTFIVLITVGSIFKNNTYLYGFLLCLGPGLLFVFVSMCLPISNLVAARAGKGVIAFYVVAYVLKYAAIIGIPFIGITFEVNFNRWVMLGTTLVAPIIVIISKFIFANVVSKNLKNGVK